MRLNQYLAASTKLSRRSADQAIADGRVVVNNAPATLGMRLEPGDTVELDGKTVAPPARATTVLFHKPAGYVTSRRKQGTTATIYTLIPTHLHHLNPVGRLDKDSSGLLIMTSDGQLAQDLSHPSSGKWKSYEVTLDKSLSGADRSRIARGVELDDGISRMQVTGTGKEQLVRLQEGRNRQIRRTFDSLGYRIIKLHRIAFGEHTLGSLKPGAVEEVDSQTNA